MMIPYGNRDLPALLPPVTDFSGSVILRVPALRCPGASSAVRPGTPCLSQGKNITPRHFPHRQGGFGQVLVNVFQKVDQVNAALGGVVQTEGQARRIAQHHAPGHGGLDKAVTGVQFSSTWEGAIFPTTPTHTFPSFRSSVTSTSITVTIVPGNSKSR